MPLLRDGSANVPGATGLNDEGFIVGDQAAADAAAAAAPAPSPSAADAPAGVASGMDSGICQSKFVNLHPGVL